VTLIKPTSTTLYGLPGTAWNGLVHHRIALDLLSQRDIDMSIIQNHLKQAIESFNYCLGSTGRPQLSVCELGSARAYNMFAKIIYDGDDKTQEEARFVYETQAKIHYEHLLVNWEATNGHVINSTSIKSFACSGAFMEARDYTVEGPAYKRNNGLSTGALFAIIFGVLGGVSILAYAGYYIYRARKRGNSNSGGGLIDYNVMLDADDV